MRDVVEQVLSVELVSVRRCFQYPLNLTPDLLLTMYTIFCKIAIILTYEFMTTMIVLELVFAFSPLKFPMTLETPLDSNLRGGYTSFIMRSIAAGQNRRDRFNAD